MTQNHIILIFFIELALFYLMFYMLFVANKWVCSKKQEMESLLIDLPEAIKGFRKEINQFNRSITSKKNSNPLSVTEIGNLAGEIALDLMKSRMPIPFVGGKLPIVSVIMKLWKYRNRIKATFTNQAL